MADGGGERTETKTRDVDDLLADVDDITDEESKRHESSRATTVPGTAEPTTTETEGSTLRERAGEVFSLKTFVAALVLAAIGSAVGGFIPIPLVDSILAFAGIFLATFVIGAASARQHYPEAGLAAGLVAGGSALQSHFYLAFVGGSGPLLIAASAVIGLVCGLLGHYFGRDLRDGLTREI